MNLDDTQEILARHDRTIANATTRARVVQDEIESLRTLLGMDGTSPKDVAHIAILASLDAEMAYLMKIPGVAQALFDEGAP